MIVWFRKKRLTRLLFYKHDLEEQMGQLAEWARLSSDPCIREYWQAEYRVLRYDFYKPTCEKIGKLKIQLGEF